MPSEYEHKTLKSKQLYERAKRVLPAGVSYGIRYFEPYPFYTARAKGSKLYDVDGNQYIDFWLGHTALILGHSPPAVVNAVKKQLENGTHFGTSHELEIKLAEQVSKMVPSAEMVRFTNSGTEANMYATRLARAYTGKRRIAKFIGGWHGGYDALHIGVKHPFDTPESAGLTEGATRDTVLLQFNDLDGAEQRLKNQEVASIIIEPVLGAGGGIPAEAQFLKGLREFCTKNNILLVFDEVITGFRLAPGGAQEYYGVEPDLTVLGKILGGGFPVGAFCGSREIMRRLDTTAFKKPEYSFHGGTFAGNPVTLTAGLATLETLQDGQLIRGLNRSGEKARRNLHEAFAASNRSVQVVGEGSLFNVHFTDKKLKNAVDVSRADKHRLLEYNLELIANGVFLLPTHTGALCTEHSETDIEKLIDESEKYARKQKIG